MKVHNVFALTLPFIPILTLDVHIVYTEQRLVMMSVSLHAQTGLPNLTIQVLNT